MGEQPLSDRRGWFCSIDRLGHILAEILGPYGYRVGNVSLVVAIVVLVENGVRRRCRRKDRFEAAPECIEITALCIHGLTPRRERGA